jgi:hypothetical protein
MPPGNFHDRDIQFATLLQSREWVVGFGSQKERSEARAISDWAFTEHFAAVTNQYDLNNCTRGDDPPDFVFTGKGRVAVEVTLIVSSRKAIFDREGSAQGAYTSVLRKTRPTREFHETVRDPVLPEDSLVRPYFESVGDLDSDYFDFAIKALIKKGKDAAKYVSLYDHIIILINDELSELESCLSRRLPQLSEIRRSVQIPVGVEVVIMNTGMSNSGIAHVL